MVVHIFGNVDLPSVCSDSESTCDFTLPREREREKTHMDINGLLNHAKRHRARTSISEFACKPVAFPAVPFRKFLLLDSFRKDEEIFCFLFHVKKRFGQRQELPLTKIANEGSTAQWAKRKIIRNTTNRERNKRSYQYQTLYTSQCCSPACRTTL